ncbi:MAG: S8 family peptidase [Candidatus Cloacimonetes bacterium]|nr:S8 family peptidase [Candidatus Cloacimonadota bacterium]
MYTKTIIIVLFLLATISLFAEESDFYPGKIIVCFSADLVGNTRGAFEITYERGVLRTPFTWFNDLVDDFQIISLERLFFVKDKEWHQNGRYPMNVFRLEINQHSRTTDLMSILKTNNNILFVEQESVVRFDSTVNQTFQSEKNNHSAKPKRSLPNDPLLPQQWYLEKIQAIDAWEITTGSPDVVIGIVDTGVKWNHEDLAANMWINEAELPGITIDWENGTISGGDCPGTETHIDGVICSGDNDGNGYCDDVIGWDFFTEDYGQGNNPNLGITVEVHGTGGAGIIAAVGNNHKGIVGIAYNSKMVATKHVRPNNIPVESRYFYDGVIYLADLGIRIINCSFLQDNEEIGNLIVSYAKQQGSLIIASAGNLNADIPRYPAAAIDAIGVAATDMDDAKLSNSSYGAWVDISAPSGALLTTWHTQDQIDTYEYYGGTSAAAPVVSGVAALLLSKNPSLTVDELKYYLLAGADLIDNLNPDYEGKLGAGRVNALNSLNLITIPIFPPPINLEAISGYEEVALTWHLPIPSNYINENLSLSGFIVYRNNISISDIITETRFIDKNVSNQTAYSYSVTAVYVNPDVESIPSVSVSITTKFPIRNLRIVHKGYDVHFDWQQPSGSDFSFNFYRNNEILSNTQETSYVDTNTTPGTYYAYKIAVLYNSGESPTTEYQVVIPLFNPPTNLLANLNNNNVELNWQEPEEMLDFEILFGYMVFRDDTQLTSSPISDLTFIDTDVESGKYTYNIFTVYALGNSEPITVDVLVGEVSEDIHSLEIFITSLIGNYPNPFNPETVITFSMEYQGNVTIDIYNIRGQIVHSLLNKSVDKGVHSVVFNGTELRSGVYFYVMKTDNYTETLRMILLK